MGVVKLGDASTWKLQETLRDTQAARAAAPAGASDAAPAARGVIRLPVSRPPEALPAAPKPEFKRKAWPDGKITVKYPAGFDPVTRQFRRDDGGAPTSPRKLARVGGCAAASGPAPAGGAPADSELKRKRAERFGIASPPPVAPPAGDDEAAALRAYEAEYAAAAAEQARLRAAFAELRREHAAATAPARGGGRGGGRGAGRGAGRGQGRGATGGIASRLSLPGAAPARTAAAAAPVSVAAKLGMSLDDLRRS